MFVILQSKFFMADDLHINK